MVAPGADYEALCDEICRTAAEMVNPATGEPRRGSGAQDRRPLSRDHAAP